MQGPFNWLLFFKAESSRADVRHIDRWQKQIIGSKQVYLWGEGRGKISLVRSTAYDAADYDDSRSV
jgi:hypothetical protein